MMKSCLTGFATLLLLVIFSATVKAQTSDSVAVDLIKTVTLKVKGITCSSDLPIINKNVKDMKGVAACNPVGKAAPTTAFKISYNPLIITEEEIIKAVESSPSCDFPDQKPYKVKGKN